LLPHAAGRCSEAEVLGDLGSDLSRYLLTPGRRVQSLRQSAEEAWVKLYRADAHAPNNQISYYLKGAVLSLVLDLHLRRHGSALPVVLRDLWRRLGEHGRGYHEEDLVAAFAAQASDLQPLLPAWLRGLEDPPLAAALTFVGLKLEPTSAPLQWVGWQLQATPQGLTLQRLVRDAPAQNAGLTVGDELLALDGWRICQPDDLAPLLPADHPPVERTVLYSRDGQVRSTRLLPEPAAVDHWSLVLDPEASEAAAERRRRWLALELP
jgi:predicted metalloprotease with PDZ domain